MSMFWCRECGEANQQLACPECGAMYSMTIAVLEAADRMEMMRNLGANLQAVGYVAFYSTTARELDDKLYRANLHAAFAEIAQRVRERINWQRNLAANFAQIGLAASYARVMHNEFNVPAAKTAARCGIETTERIADVEFYEDNL